jgi:hypothetical protein
MAGPMWARPIGMGSKSAATCRGRAARYPYGVPEQVRSVWYTLVLEQASAALAVADTADAYPAVLPAPMVEGYELEQDRALLRTDMEIGAARVRRITADAPTKVRLRWLFRQSEMALFEAWYHYRLADGARWFRINLASGQGIQEMEARFVSRPARALERGMRFVVRAELEVRELPIMTESEMEDALAG